jgi:uncharacterized membrane protein YeaQ/YmgE (transglycosylase-associated protein family)/uncharacterized protein YjbJ (UPF0337 family)
MSYIIWLFAGAALGCLTTIIIRRRHSMLLLNIIVGIVGGFVVGSFLLPVFHIRTINQGIFNLPVLMVSIGGAIILLGIVNFFRREKDVKNEVIERKWMQVRNKIHARWSKITEADIDKINGNLNRFITTLQERYGYAKEDAEDQIQRYLKAVLGKTGPSFLYDPTRVADPLPGNIK